jgi:hypothetical protein
MALKSTLVAELIAVVGGFIPVGDALPPPVIVEEEPAVLQQRACGEPCKVVAWYGPDGIIYLDRRIDPEANIMARSVLIHELVHHVQRQQTGHNADGCEQWLSRERQAYEIQARWLFEQGVDARPLFMQARTLMCGPAESRGGQAGTDVAK